MKYISHSEGPPQRPRARTRAASLSAPRAQLLERVGATVRTQRQSRGLTLRALADRAGVSERFLIQLEAGDGNISIVRLEDVAEALGTSAAEILTRAGAKAPRRAREPAPKITALVGLRGAGKSSVGALVARALDRTFVELDELIVQHAQMTLPSIFEIHGESYYRDVERVVVEGLLRRRERCIVATGGSLVTAAGTWRLLREGARTIWLKATPREHWDRVVAQGDVRPMQNRPRAKNELRALLRERERLYREANETVDTSGRDLRSVANDVVRVVRMWENHA